MSAYIITGEARSVSKMYIGVDGKARQVKKAYIGVDGAAKLWYQLGSPLGNLAVGSTVKIAVGGKDYDWLVVHQGLPGSMYDASCNGTWLLMEDIYTNMQFNSSKNNLFVSSPILQYLNTTFHDAIDANVRKLIKVATIPYMAKNNSTTASSGDLRAWVFLLSMTEVGFVGGASNYMPIEGAKLRYFSAHGREAYFNGTAAEWWSRTPFGMYNSDVWCVDKNGDNIREVCLSSFGVRPCMILPQDALVDDTGHIIAADDPRTPLGLYSVGSTIKMDVNGNKRVWRIAYKGNPNPNLYDESCNGVWLVLNTIYSTRANGNDCQYAGGTIDTYLNGTFLERIDKDGNAAKYIKDVKIPYTKKQGDGSWEVQTKENGLSCKVFLPSIFEIGGAENLSIYKDGSKLGYYDGSPSTLTLEQSGTPAPWRTRTVTSDAQSEFSVDATGTITTCAPTDVIGVVPCVIMKPDALVENGIIIGE